MQQIEHRRDSRGRHFARVHGPGGVQTTPKREEAWTDAQALDWFADTVSTPLPGAREDLDSLARMASPPKPGLRDVAPRPAATGSGFYMPAPEPVEFRPAAIVPPVTVAVRCHAPREDWLRGAVESVLKQRVNVEALIVCDGYHGTLWGLDHDPRVGVVRLGHNGGAAASRNAAHAYARGDYIRVLDDDDELPDGCLAKQIAALDEHPEALLCFGKLVVMGHERRRWIQDKALAEALKESPEIPLAELVRDHHWTLLPLPTAMMRRSHWIPAVPEDFFTAEDNGWVRQALAMYPERSVVYLANTPCLRYRYDEAGNSGHAAADASPQAQWRRSLTTARVESARLLAQHTMQARSAARPLRLGIFDWQFMAGGAQWRCMQVAQHYDRRLVEPVFLSIERTRSHDWLEAHGIECRVKPVPEPWIEWVAKQAAGLNVLATSWAASLIEPKIREAANGLVGYVQSTTLSWNGLTADNAELLGRFDGFVAVSQAVLDINPHIAARPHLLAYSPVDAVRLRRIAQTERAAARLALGARPEQLVVVWSGRLMGTEKHASHAVEIAKRLRDQLGDGVLVVMAGHITEGHASSERFRAEWEQTVATAPVRWLDGVWPWEMPGVYAAADVYLSTSSVEGMSLSQLEGMAARCVPVVTDVGGVRETVCDGVSGYVTRVGDVEALTERILRLAGDRELREAMAWEACHAAGSLCDVREIARQEAFWYRRMFG